VNSCHYQTTPFTIEEGELGKDKEALALILKRQISYFADEGGFEALLKSSAIALGVKSWR